MVTNQLNSEEKKVLYSQATTLNSGILYQGIFPTHYKKIGQDDQIEQALVTACLDISKRYDIAFLEIGVLNNDVFFFIESVPTYSADFIIDTIKQITTTEIFKTMPHLKNPLFDVFWSKGNCIQTVSSTTSSEPVLRFWND